jgi:hypothetical protein
MDSAVVCQMKAAVRAMKKLGEIHFAAANPLNARYTARQVQKIENFWLRKTT